MKKLFYKIGEVASLLGENVSLVRYWSEYFSDYIKPERNAKGNRLFTENDVEIMKQIHFLVRHNGLTLEGAAAVIASGKSTVDGRVKALDMLKSIREQLVEVRALL